MSVPGMPKCYSVAIAATAQVLNIRMSRAISIQVDSGQDLYVTFDGSTPSVGGASSLRIPGGTLWQSPQNINLGINQINWIGSAATGRFSVFAA